MRVWAAHGSRNHTSPLTSAQVCLRAGGEPAEGRPRRPALRPCLARRPRRSAGKFAVQRQEVIYARFRGEERGLDRGLPRRISDHSASRKEIPSQSFLDSAGRTLPGRALSATFTKPPPPWCNTHKYILGVRRTLEIIFTDGAEKLARNKEGEVPSLAFRLWPGSAALYSFRPSPHLSR